MRKWEEKKRNQMERAHAQHVDFHLSTIYNARALCVPSCRAENMIYQPEGMAEDLLTKY